MVLEGRPLERRRLLGAFTDIIVDVLGVDRRLVHGRIISVHPEDWAIGGVPVGIARRGQLGAPTVTSS
jgi:4-oxalocrotonate tautomerase